MRALGNAALVAVTLVGASSCAFSRADRFRGREPGSFIDGLPRHGQRHSSGGSHSGTVDTLAIDASPFTLKSYGGR